MVRKNLPEIVQESLLACNGKKCFLVCLSIGVIVDQLPDFFDPLIHVEQHLRECWVFTHPGLLPNYIVNATG